MALGTQTELDDNVDSKHNVAQNQADNRFNYSPGKELNDREKGVLDDIEAGLKGDNDGDTDSKGAGEKNGLKDIESLAGSRSGRQIDANRVMLGGMDVKKMAKTATKLAKSRSPLLAIFAMFGVTGGLLTLVFNPGALLISLQEQLQLHNDTSATSLQRRALKVIGHVSSNQENHEVCATSKMRCHMGRFSNNALRRLDRNGLKPVWNTGGPDGGRIPRTGYPDKNPDAYDYTRRDGTVQRVQATELEDFLRNRENRQVARKVLGPGGAFNMRYRAFMSYHLRESFLRKFRLSKAADLADGKSKTRKKMSELSNKINEKVPGSEKIRQASTAVRGKVTKHIGKARKAGAGYVIAVAGCASVRIPKYIAVGIASVQLAQLIPHVQEFVLSPGSKTKAHGFDSEITSEDVDSLSGALIDPYPYKDGTNKAAVESPYLLNALGVDKNRPAPSKSFSPAFAFIDSPVYRGASTADRATREQCDVILSPQAMYTAMAVSMATTVAASSTIVGGLVKVAAEWVIGEIVVWAIREAAEGLATEILEDLATNDKIPNAKGRDLGDILGIGAVAYFSGVGMARGQSVLSRSQAVAFNKIRQEEENFQKEMDIAALSPFDTSSRHTFLGSILHNTRIAMVANGVYSGNASGILSTIAHLPSLAISPKANAFGISDNYCSYAEDYDIIAGGEGGDDAPCITFAGTPVTGITNQQAAISTDRAIKLMEDEEWFDEEQDIDDGAGVFELVATETVNENTGDVTVSEDGYIKADTPLSDFIGTCTDLSTGDILINAVGCMTNQGGSGDFSAANNHANNLCNEATEDRPSTCAGSASGLTRDSDHLAADNPAAIAAITPFLLDYQILQSINNEDDEEKAAPAAAGAGQPAPNAPPSKDGWHLPVDAGTPVSGEWGVPNFVGTHRGIDFGAGAGKNIYAAHDGTITFNGQVSAACGGGIRVKVAGQELWYIYQHIVPLPGMNVGTNVTGGQQIATVQNLVSSCSSGPHLHFGIETQDRFSGARSGPNTSVNPRDYLPL